jgi:hypothetical protein
MIIKLGGESETMQVVNSVHFVRVESPSGRSRYEMWVPPNCQLQKM